EEVVAIIESVRATRDVVIVEGLIPEVDIQVATRLNIEMIKSLGADVVPVLSARHGDRTVRRRRAPADCRRSAQPLLPGDRGGARQSRIAGRLGPGGTGPGAG